MQSGMGAFMTQSLADIAGVGGKEASSFWARIREESAPVWFFGPAAAAAVRLKPSAAAAARQRWRGRAAAAGGGSPARVRPQKRSHRRLRDGAVCLKGQRRRRGNGGEVARARQVFVREAPVRIREGRIHGHVVGQTRARNG